MKKLQKIKQLKLQEQSFKYNNFYRIISLNHFARTSIYIKQFSKKNSNGMRAIDRIIKNLAVEFREYLARYQFQILKCLTDFKYISSFARTYNEEYI
ncbi:hypothetical protein pb186bvf_014824 [Paramecium bursaria]